MWANSPAAVALLAAHTQLGVPIDCIRLISVATGDFAHGTSAKDFGEIRPYSLEAIRTILELMFAAQADYADQIAKTLLPRDNFLRVSAPLDKIIQLDDVDEALRRLPALAEAQAEATLKDFKRLFLSGTKYELTAENMAPSRATYDLVSQELIGAAGLTALYPSRAYYATHRSFAPTIDTYVTTAHRTLVIVSVNLMTGLPVDGICSALTSKFETSDFTATISLLDPRISGLMEALAPALDVKANELASEIRQNLRKLVAFRDSLGEGKSRLSLRVHKAIPFASAILLDHRDPRGRIQLETKAYRQPLKCSFALEFAPAGASGLYASLVKGYETLLEESSPIDPDVLGE